MSAVRRSEIKKAVEILDDLRNYTRMSPEHLAKVSKKWREVWMTSPLTRVIDLLDAELIRSVEKKAEKK
jgi:uncharacterized membrane protein